MPKSAAPCPLPPPPRCSPGNAPHTVSGPPPPTPRGLVSRTEPQPPPPPVMSRLVLSDCSCGSQRNVDRFPRPLAPIGRPSRPSGTVRSWEGVQVEFKGPLIARPWPVTGPCPAWAGAVPSETGTGPSGSEGADGGSGGGATRKRRPAQAAVGDGGREGKGGGGGGGSRFCFPFWGHF